MAIDRTERWRLTWLTASAVVCFAIAGVTAADAATLTWGATGTGGSGTWTATNAWWNGTTQQAWSNAAPDDAIFGGTGGTVTLAGGTTTAGSITFDTFSGTSTIGSASQTLTVNGGGIMLNAGAGVVTFQSSPITLGAAQSWTNNSSSLLTLSSGVTNNGNLLTVAGSGSTTLSGAVAGSGGLTKSGGGRLTLSASNAYFGPTTVTNGLVVGSNLNSFGSGAISIDASGTVQMTAWNGANQTSLPAFYSNGSTNAVSGSGVLSLVGQSAAYSVNYSGNLSAFSGTVSATGAAGTFVGVGNTASEAIRLSGSNTRFMVSGVVLLPVIDTAATIAFGELSGDGVVSAKFNVNSAWQIGGLSTSSTFSGRFQDNLNVTSGRLSLIKVGSGTLSLTGTNLYTGTTTISAGRLALTGNGMLGSGSYAGAIANAGELVLGSDVAQILSGAISGTGGLAKTSVAMLTLSGNSSYSGGTRIDAGILAFGAATALGTGTVTVGGGVLQSAAAVTLANPISITATSGTFDSQANASTLSGAISGAGRFVKIGTGTLTLSASNAYSGGTTVTNGVVVGSNRNAFGAGTVEIGASGTAQVTALAANYYSNGVTNAVSGSGVLRLVGQSGASSVNYSGNLSAFTGMVSATSGSGTFVAVGDAATASFLSGSNARFDVSGPGAFYPLSTVSSSGTFAMGELRGNGFIQNRFNSTSTLRIGDLATSSTFSGILQNNVGGGILALAKVGAGSLTLTGANSYSGATTISGGRLEIGTGGQFNGTSGITINGAGAELKYNSTTALTRPITFTQGTLSGTGTIGTPFAVGANAVLSPGNSPGTLTGTAGVTWSPGGTYAWEINSLTGTAGNAWDLLAVTGGGLNLSALSTGNRFTLDLFTLDGSNAAGPLDAGYVPGSSYEFLIASFNSLAVPGTFSNAANSDLTGLFTISLANWQGTKPNVVDMSVKVNSEGTGISLVIVPEPTAMMLAAMGIAVAGWAASRSRRRAS